MRTKILWQGFWIGAVYGLSVLLLEDLFNLLLRPFDFTLKQLLFTTLSYSLFWGVIGAIVGSVILLLRVFHRSQIPARTSLLLLGLVGITIFFLGYKDLPVAFFGLGFGAKIVVALFWLIFLVGLGVVLFLLMRRGSGQDPNILLARTLAMTTATTFFALLIMKIDFDAYWGARLESVSTFWRLIASGSAIGLFGLSIRFYQRIMAVPSSSAPKKHRKGLLLFSAALTLFSVTSLVLLAARRPSDTLAIAETRVSSSPPNIILIVLDAVRADHLSLYGYERSTSPNLEQYGKRGLLFSNAFAPSSWTKQSIPAILTGQYPGRLGVEDFLDLLPDEVVLIPEILHPLGYATVGFSANTFISPYFHFNQGFDQLSYVPRHGPKQILFSKNMLTYAFAAMPELMLQMDLVDQNFASADVATVNHEVSHWLSRNANSQYFLYIHYMDPHQPYTPTKKNFSRGKHLSRADIASSRGMHNPLDTIAVDSHAQDVFVSRYDDEIAYLDQGLGELFQRFDQWGIWDHSLVIVTADHGEEFADHGFAGHGHTLFQESIHVPLLIFFPDSTLRGKVIADYVSLLDLAPTICAMAGNSAPIRFDGASLLPLVQSAAAPSNSAIRPILAALNNPNRDWPYSYSCAALRAPYKFIHNKSRLANISDWEGLFDLNDDPGEKRNLLEELPEIAEELTQEVQNYQKSCDSLNIPHASYDESQRLDFLAEQLRAIGYVH